MRMVWPLVAGLLVVPGIIGKVAEKRQPLIPCPSEWQVTRAEYGGQSAKDARLTFTHTKATGDRVWVFAMVGNEIVVHHVWAEYELNTAAVPAQFDFRDRKGIYTFEGDVLKICFAGPGEPRPKHFRTVLGDSSLLLVLKRHDGN
jgi:uncharacterized protein (TIGR03067 family)